MKYISIILLAVAITSCESAKKKLADQIKASETKLFNDSMKVLNLQEANAVYKNYILYADTYKEDTSSADYLFKAADLANGLNRPKESIELFERLRNSFPQYRKSSSALFMEAFIYETAMNDKESAKKKYKEFIAAYPDHKLTPSAKASLDQLNSNLSDEEMIKMFEAKNK